MNQRLSHEMVLRYVAGRASEEERLRVEQAVAQSDECLAQVRGALLLCENFDEVMDSLSAEELGRVVRAIRTRQCKVFRDHVHEFSEMTQERQEAEAPELTAHLKSCPSCWRIYWKAAVPFALSPQHGGKPVLRLREPIMLRISRSHLTVDRGVGPPPDEVEYVGIAAGHRGVPVEVAGEELAEPLRWTLHDEEAKCEVRLTLRGRDDNHSELSCLLDLAKDSPVESSDRRLELMRVGESGELYLYLAGPLDNFVTAPALLPVGSWVIRVLAGLPSDKRVWELPVELWHGKANEDDLES